MADIVQAHSTATDGHGHGHGANPYLAHHFDTMPQQFDAGKLGMWVFLATEVLFFAGLFCFYSVYRRLHPEIFIIGHKHLDVFWGATNTIVLIASSFTMALGVLFAQKGNRPGLIICLILTLMGAAGFMGIKSIEYSHKIHEGLVWGSFYSYKPGEHASAGHSGSEEHAAGATAGEHAPAAAPAVASAAPVGAGPALTEADMPKIPNAAVAPGGIAPKADEHSLSEADVKNLHIFFSIYFCLTGLHGIHVLAGMVVLSWLLWGAIKGRFSASYYTPVDLGGLYWHLVDLVWIYLFPLLYLIH